MCTQVSQAAVRGSPQFRGKQGPEKTGRKKRTECRKEELSKGSGLRRVRGFGYIVKGVGEPGAMEDIRG